MKSARIREKIPVTFAESEATVIFFHQRNNPSVFALELILALHCKHILEILYILDNVAKFCNPSVVEFVSHLKFYVKVKKNHEKI